MPQIWLQLLHGNNAEARAPPSTALSHKWYNGGKSGKKLTSVVSDGEIGALAGQAESERSWLVIFVCGSQSS